MPFYYPQRTLSSSRSSQRTTIQPEYEPQAASTTCPSCGKQWASDNILGIIGAGASVAAGAFGIGYTLGGRKRKS